MTDHSTSRRGFLKGVAAVGACTLLTASPRLFAAAPADCQYKFVNNTAGRWSDAECFWSMDNGSTWNSFKSHPTAPCPTGNGRVYIRLGQAPRNFDDRDTYWDFIEYAYGDGRWSGNTTQVDAFCIPITLAMGGHRVGIVGNRADLFKKFLADCPSAFRDCVKGDIWIMSPARAGFGKTGPHADYFQAYIDEVWKTYADATPTPSGKYTGKVNGDSLTFTPVAGGKSYTCAGKPDTQDVLLGQGVLAANAPFCAAFNRHVAADPADWHTPARYYQANPCNWYARFLHTRAIDHKCYGFCYDDFADQAAYFSAKGNEVAVTVNWG